MNFGASVALSAVTGAAIGSFLNVVAYRLPRRASIVRPRSSCPACGAEIAAYDNVPVFSWVLLRGRCRRCQARISARYPLLEMLTAALFAAVVVSGGGAGEVVSGLVLVATLVVVTAIDLEHRIVPNRVLGPAALAAVVIWAVADPHRLGEDLIAALAAGMALFLPALVYPAGMGMGDVKLAAVLGLFLGKSVAPAMFVAFICGSVVGIGIMVVRGPEARKSAIPFAPYLALGGLVGLLFGPDIVDWYLRLS
jgi:leader peptidase (prepilin peptidase) / N-methyltransferase